MKKRSSAGFTLLEMLVVMAIVAGLSVGGFNQWVQWQQQQRLAQSIHLLRAFLMSWRDDSAWKNLDVRLYVHREDGLWCISTTEHLAGGCRSLPRQVYSPVAAEIQLVSMTDGLGFYGARNTARSGRIVIRSPAGEGQLIVSAWGRIRVCGPGEITCE
ncbi:prepilin-type N-terminal cleavage/methylation domain-containing protein [Mangrovibacter yixingensis]|uniref:prepilin-type N-terminal cleavage/methylation domain-containing protein n=1 Tax=Mangrovibacter yixingensis TaxID=1529639 RepID=UPI001CFC9043|nr:prepilin-type N-terminal cleavage/methylation domain-containing protein [Mangrovibacter yixingensis]